MMLVFSLWEFVIFGGDISFNLGFSLVCFICNRIIVWNYRVFDCKLLIILY